GPGRDPGSGPRAGAAVGAEALSRTVAAAGGRAAPGLGRRRPRPRLPARRAAGPPGRRTARRPAGPRTGPRRPPRALGALGRTGRRLPVLVVSAGVVGAAPLADPRGRVLRRLGGRRTVAPRLRHGHPGDAGLPVRRHRAGAGQRPGGPR